MLDFENLTNHGGLTCPAQTAENEYLALWLAVDKIMQLPEALAPAISENRCCKGTQGFTGADICGKCGKTCGLILYKIIPHYTLKVKGIMGYDSVRAFVKSESR